MPVPISESDNTDAIALRSAIALLQLQKEKSRRDIRTLERVRQSALGPTLAGRRTGHDREERGESAASAAAAAEGEEEEEEEDVKGEIRDSFDTNMQEELDAEEYSAWTRRTANARPPSCGPLSA